MKMPLRARNAWLMILTGALACSSCEHQVKSWVPADRRTAVATVMERHISNAVDAGDGDLETRALRRRLATNPRDLDARILLARVYLRRGFPDLALEHDRLAAMFFPDEPVAVLEQAKVLRQMEQTDAALSAVVDFLAKHPAGNAELFSMKGVLEDETGNFREAESAYRAGLALVPASSALHNNLGYNLLLQGHPELAAEQFRSAIAIDPSLAVAHNNLALALASQPQPSPKEALREWERAGDAASAHNNLAAVLIEQGHYAEARVELDAALRIRRDFPAALANLELVSERDAKPATVPAVPVNFWRRIASRLGYFIVGEDPPKPPSPDAAAKPDSGGNK